MKHTSCIAYMRKRNKKELGTVVVTSSYERQMHKKRKGKKREKEKQESAKHLKWAFHRAGF